MPLPREEDPVASPPTSGSEPKPKKTNPLLPVNSLINWRPSEELQKRINEMSGAWVKEWARGLNG